MTPFQQFEANARAAGFDEVNERRWAPGAEVARHTHDFDARAVLIAGEMWLTVDDSTRHLRCGEGFEVPRGCTHAERYGPQGTELWVARRHAR